MTGTRKMGRALGFALVELIIFIVIASVLIVGLFAAFANNLRNTPKAGQIDRAADIAQQRMELILAQRRAVGFATFADPCPGPAVCAAPTGYSVTSSIVLGWNADPLNYKIVTVDVTGPISATATSLVAKY